MNAPGTAAPKTKYKPTPINWRDARDVNAPKELQAATAALCELAANENAFIDAMSNSTADNFKAIVAHIATCREALDGIEAMARGRIEAETRCLREQLESIEALGVPLEA
jgi:hypothetical protein